MSTNTLLRTDHPRVQIDHLYSRDFSLSERAFAGDDDLSYEYVIASTATGMTGHFPPQPTTQIKTVLTSHDFPAVHYGDFEGMTVAGGRIESNTEMAANASATGMLSVTVHQPYVASGGANHIFWVKEPVDLLGNFLTGLERTEGVVYVDASGIWWGDPSELGRGSVRSRTRIDSIHDAFLEATNAEPALTEPAIAYQWIASNRKAAHRVHSLDTAEAPQWHSVAREFSFGANGRIPTRDDVAKVDRIIKAVIAGTDDAEYSVDEDGAFSFEATLSSGLFIMCEVSLAGNINAGLYHGADGDLEKFLTRPSEEELLGLV